MKSRSLLLLALATAFVIALAWSTRHRANSPASPPTAIAPAASDSDDPLATARPPRRAISSPRSTSASTNNLTPWQQTLARLQSGESLEIPREKVEGYVRRCNRDAPSLLAAYRITRDKIYLTEAAQTHPNDPRIQTAMLASSDLAPEQRREWLDRLKQSAPENPLANYLTASDLFKANQPTQALAELTAAGAKRRFDDYVTTNIQATEEMLLLAGHSPIEAKVNAFSGTLLPHLGSLNGIAKELATLQKDYVARGDLASAESLAILGLNVARQINEGPSHLILIEQLVSMSMEKRVLEPLAQNQRYDFLGQTPAERLTALKTQRDEIRALTKGLDAFDPASGLTEPELLVYFERLKSSGELEALRWLNANRTNAP